MTVEPSSTNPSRVLSGDGDGNGNGNDHHPPPLQRTAWAQVVARGEPEPLLSEPPLRQSSVAITTAEQSTFYDCSASSMGNQPENSSTANNSSNAGHSTKPAWNKPLNGVVEGVGPVMGGAVSWPALSEATTRPPSKSTASHSSNPSSDAPVSTSQGPVISHSKNKSANNTNPNPSLTPNHTLPARQRSSKRGGGGGARARSVQNCFSRPPPLPLHFPPPPPPPFPLFDMAYGSMVAAVPEYFLGEPPYKGNSWEGLPVGGFALQPSSVNYQSSQRNSSRRGNFGGNLQGGGLQHNSNGSSRDQRRGLNASRSFNARDIRATQQIAPPRGFLRPLPPPPPPGSIPFITPQSAGHFGYPMGFDMTLPLLYGPTPSLEPVHEVPFTSNAPPPPPFPSVLEGNLCAALVRQIDYYFSDDNLVRDRFLRSKMDDEGWVPINLIAGFPLVKQWTNDVQLIFDSLKASSLVEVQPYRVRRRDEWRKWIPTSSRFATDSGSQHPIGSTDNTITSSLQKVTLDEGAANKTGIMNKADSSTEMVLCRSSSAELTDHPNMANGECVNGEGSSTQI